MWIKVVSFIENSEKYFQNTQEKLPHWMNVLREMSLSQLDMAAIPTVKDEEWKYTDISKVLKQKYYIVDRLEDANLAELNKVYNKDEINIVFVNGVFSPELSISNNVFMGCNIMSWHDAVKQEDPNFKIFLEKEYSEKDDYFVAMNKAYADDGVYLRIPNNTVFDKLIHIIFISVSDTESVIPMPRVLVSVGNSSEVSIQESYLGGNSSCYFNNAFSSLSLGKDSKVYFCKALNESPQSIHYSKTKVLLENESVFDSLSVTTGGNFVRNEMDIVMKGTGASATVNGFNYARNKQHIDSHTSIRHEAPECSSNQLCKYILDDKARTVFNGKIYVAPDAQKTNSCQLNKNLIFSEDCRVDTKPQLEIFADDVKCNHGATVGQLNEDEIFYLQTRSISRKDAVRILSRGFANDVLSCMKNEAILSKINALVDPIFANL